MNMIEKFINSISVGLNDYFKPDYKQVEEFTFYGDGMGDFEKSSNHTTLKCINDYIETCKQQIELAKIVGMSMINEDHTENEQERFTKNLTK